MTASVIKPLVLIVGDTTQLVTTINLLLVMVGYETVLAQTMIEASHTAQAQKPDLVILASRYFDPSWQGFCDQIMHDRLAQPMPICAIVQTQGLQAPSEFYRNMHVETPEPFELAMLVSNLDALITGEAGGQVAVSQQAQAYRQRISSEYVREVNA